MYSTTKDVLAALQEGAISAEDAEKILSNFQESSQPQQPAKRRGMSKIKKYLQNEVIDFTGCLIHLEKTVTFLREVSILPTIDVTSYTTLLKDATPEDIVSCIGFLKRYLPSPNNTRGAHEGFIAALKAREIASEVALLEEEDDNDSSSEDDDFFEVGEVETEEKEEEIIETDDDTDDAQIAAFV